MVQFDLENCDYEDGWATVSIIPDKDGKYMCRCLVCARCGHHTGNTHQGHHWGYCGITKTVREPHFCCPNDCELTTGE